MKNYLIKIFLIVALINSSCAGQTISCQQSTPIKEKITDARIIPYKSFAYIELLTQKISSCNTTQCLPIKKIYFASGVFVYRSSKDSNVGFLMTAKHLCSHKNETSIFTVYDYYGIQHHADYYFNSAVADVCILVIKDMSPNIDISLLAKSMPEVGSRTFNVSAPKKYFNPGAALIFEGIYSGFINNDKSIFTIPTMSGSSGSPVFNDQGQLIAMIVAFPMQQYTEGKYINKTRVVESLGIAESLSTLKIMYDSLVTVDEIFGFDLFH
jgi:hypothetical protein